MVLKNTVRICLTNYGNRDIMVEKFKKEVIELWQRMNAWYSIKI